VEQIASLRAMPNLLVFRPADAVETAECWKLALKAEKSPSVMALSRQKTPPVRNQGGHLSARGAYEVSPADGEARVTIFSAGTEVAIAVAAQKLLQAEGVPTRVVSTPCWELFEEQDAAYRNSVIGAAPVRVAVEAGVRMGWDRFIGQDGAFVGMTGFGASAPYERLYKEFGITAEAVAAAAKAKL
jgi:transketolase